MNKAQAPTPTPLWELTVRIEDEGLMKLIADVYAMSDEKTKQYIEIEMRRMVSQKVESAMKK